MKIQNLILLSLFTVYFSLFPVFAQEEGIIESLKFKEADIRVVLQAIAQKAVREGKKINIIITPDVTGLINADLDNIEWETALEVILKTYGYGYAKYKDVIIVDSLEKIKEREAQEKERQEVELPQLKVFKLRYLDANDAKGVVEPLLSSVGKVSVLELTGLAGWKFGTDALKRERVEKGKKSRTKILVVSDISRKLDEIETLLREIDIMPKQILIRARIMEVGRDLLKDIGFDWGTGTTGGESSTITLIPSSKNDGSTVTEAGGHMLGPQLSGFVPKTTSLTAANAGLKLMFRKLTGSQFEVILHALEEDARTNTLSAPTILTLNNQEASILVGVQFPIVSTQISTQTSQITGGSLQEYKKIGVQLNVVPQISGEKEEFINMIVHPAVTSYTDTVKLITEKNVTLLEYPIIAAREAETQILVKDGETIVMGGLFKDVKIKHQVGVPILKDFPLLGWFFRRNTYDTEKMDLLIFITAKIIKPGEVVDKEDLAADTFDEPKK